MSNLEKVREVIESQYIGTCTIKELQTNKNPVTKIDESIEVEIAKDKPCRKSYKNIKASANNDEINNSVTQVVELFIAPEIIIKPGSKIIVTQNGETITYTRSGEPAKYPTHQQVLLDLWKGWA